MENNGYYFWTDRICKADKDEKESQILVSFEYNKNVGYMFLKHSFSWSVHYLIISYPSFTIKQWLQRLLLQQNDSSLKIMLNIAFVPSFFHENIFIKHAEIHWSTHTYINLPFFPSKSIRNPQFLTTPCFEMGQSSHMK